MGIATDGKDQLLQILVIMAASLGENDGQGCGKAHK